MNTRTLLLAIMPLLLAGCGATSQLKQGKALIAAGEPEKGFAVLDVALQEHPTDTTLHAFVTAERERLVRKLVREAEDLVAQDQLPSAGEKLDLAHRLAPNDRLVKEGRKRLQINIKHQGQLREMDRIITADPSQARTMLAQMLQEDPRNQRTKQLLDILDATLAKEQAQAPRLAAAYRAPVSLMFRDQNLMSLFDVISRIAKINFIFDKDVPSSAKATIYAQNSSAEEAINLLLRTNELEKVVLNDSTLLIFPRTPEKIREYRELVVRTFYLSNADPKQLALLVKQLIRPKDVQADERLNAIVVRDTPDVVAVVERLIRAQDLPQSEVQLEVMVLEVNDSDLVDLGLRLPPSISLSPFGLGVNPGPSSTPQEGRLTLRELNNINQSNVLVNLGQPTATLNMNATTNNSRLLANPKIRVKNREKATIKIGDRVPVITTTTNLGVTSEMVNYQDVGLTLKVEPALSLDSDIGVKVSLEVSNIVQTITTKSGLTAYRIGQRQAETVLSSQDGETQVLAGLISSNISEEANGIPGIAQLPVLDRLFGNRKDSAQRSEIVLLITPRIVRHIPLPPPHLQQFSSGTENTTYANPLQLRPLPAVEAAPPSASQSAPASPPTPEQTRPSGGL